LYRQELKIASIGVKSAVTMTQINPVLDREKWHRFLNMDLTSFETDKSSKCSQAFRKKN
jgi:hypothetical protein